MIISLPSLAPIVIVGRVREARPVVEPPAPGGEGEEDSDGQPGDGRAEPRVPGPGRVQPALDLTECGVATQCQQGRGDRAQEDQPRVGERDSAEDVDAQAACADGRGDRRHAHAGHRGHADPAQDDRHRQGELDQPEPLHAGHPQGNGRLADPRIDAAQPEDRVLDDRQQGVEREGRQRRRLADLAPKGDQQEPEQGQAGDRLEHAGDPDRNPLERGTPRGEDAQRHAGEHREEHGLDHQLEVSRGGLEQGPSLGRQQFQPVVHHR